MKKSITSNGIGTWKSDFLIVSLELPWTVNYCSIKLIDQYGNLTWFCYEQNNITLFSINNYVALYICFCWSTSGINLYAVSQSRLLEYFMAYSAKKNVCSFHDLYMWERTLTGIQITRSLFIAILKAWKLNKPNCKLIIEP